MSLFSPLPPQVPLHDSALLSGILSSINCDWRSFRPLLTREWLPHSCFQLLYRSSRDGNSARAFHRVCDGRGPTLTLVKGVDRSVCGGYASVSWSCEGLVADPHAFVFNVTALTEMRSHPHLSTVSLPGCHRFFQRPPVTRRALLCDASSGPTWVSALEVRSMKGSGAGVFDAGRSFIDHPWVREGAGLERLQYYLGRHAGWVPEEVEVYAVTPA